MTRERFDDLVVWLANAVDSLDAEELADFLANGGLSVGGNELILEFEKKEGASSSE